MKRNDDDEGDDALEKMWTILRQGTPYRYVLCTLY
jgi:hypothetical protein